VKRAHVAGIGVTLAAIAAGVALGSRSIAPSRGASVTTIAVPRSAAPIAIDGELGEAGWTKKSARVAFVGKDGAPGRPYADARLTWDETNLYVGLYAGDRDVRAAKAKHDEPLYVGGDEFRLVFVTKDGARVVLEVSPSCTVTDARGTPLDYAWESGAKVACDVDGTVNDPSDEDEEWVVEMAIPLAALGGPPVAFGARRCDADRVCTAFPQASLAFDP
jgi:hypothetical protein